MSTAFLTTRLSSVHILAIEDMSAVANELFWLLVTGDVTCMLTDECLTRMPGLLNVHSDTKGILKKRQP